MQMPSPPFEHSPYSTAWVDAARSEMMIEEKCITVVGGRGCK
jgi:hypothetical protein